jgi:hypothetical protein
MRRERETRARERRRTGDLHLLGVGRRQVEEERWSPRNPLLPGHGQARVTWIRLSIQDLPPRGSRRLGYQAATDGTSYSAASTVS